MLMSLCKNASLNSIFLLCRIIRELEAQLEYEREKRERLESQLDKLRAQIHTLTLQLEDERLKTAIATTPAVCTALLIVINNK